jgi:hypothetical protein
MAGCKEWILGLRKPKPPIKIEGKAFLPKDDKNMKKAPGIRMAH